MSVEAAVVTKVEHYTPTHEVSQGTGEADFGHGVGTQEESTGNKHIDAILKRLDRLENLDILNRTIDHVNREVGVAQDTPLVERLAELEALCAKNFAKIKEKFNY